MVRAVAPDSFVIRLAGPGTDAPPALAARRGGHGAIAERNLVGPEGGQVLAERAVGLTSSLRPER
jgi:hypothetical protein